MGQYRHVVALTIAALVATGCGARLSDQQREFGAAVAGMGQADGVAVPGSDDGGATVPVPGSSIAPGGNPQEPSATSTPGQGDPSTAPSVGSAAAPGQPARQPTTTTDTVNAPAGGNGDATDTGVTATSIRIVNVSDVGGALPGLFDDARKATQAFVNYFTATEGTIYGRQLQLEVKDSQIQDSQNREHYLKACETAFAAVGSMSANDGGAASAIESCGLPDLRTAAVNESIQLGKTVFGMDAMKPGLLPTSEYNYWAEQFPEAIKHAAYLYIDNETTKYQGEQNTAGTRKVGYVWDMFEPIGLAETNYSSYVIRMKEKGIQFVTIQGAVSNAVNLAKAMQQQGFTPKVYALQTNLYSPALLQTGGTSIEGAQIAVTGSLLEEMERSAEMQLYAQWLARVDSSARPTGLGMYAWSAARLFTETAKAVGPNLTRAALVDAYGRIRGYDNHGLIPKQDVGTKVPADCIIIVEVRGGAFVRVEPATGTGFRCDNKVVTTR